MEYLKQFIDLVLHFDKHLGPLIQDYGPWIYLIIFLIIFCETGLVVTPFLPGDSLLFIVGAFCAGKGLNLWVILGTLTFAAILGDSVNYWTGHLLGDKIHHRFPRLIKPEHIQRTHEFYERYGGKTIIIARFVPIIRTFAPFVAGFGSMTYRRFMMFNVVGALLWIFLLVPAGYFFGNIEWVKSNFTKVVYGIIVLSVLPILIEFIRERRRRRQPGV